MKLHASISNFIWKEIGESGSDKITTEKLREHLVQRMQMNNLSILFGAGASRAVTVDPNSPEVKAPLVKDIFEELQREVSDFNEIKLLIGCEASTNFEEILSKCILHYKVNPQEKIKGFIDAAKTKLVNKINFLKPNSDLSTFESFLRCITLRPSKNRSNIFTLNYDLAIETAAAKIGFTLIDGFSFNYPHHFSPLHFDYDIIRKKETTLKLVESVAYLYKLHGSINWDYQNNWLTRTPSPIENPYIIFPTKEKFQDSYNQPFLEMVTRFKESLRCPQTTLLVVGYSCGDEHINSIINNSLDINYDLNIVFVDPNIQSNEQYKIFKNRGAISDHRLSFLEGTLEDLVKTVPSFAQQSKEEMFIKSLVKVVTQNAS